MQVIKRDKTIQEFDFNKIVTALNKAFGKEQWFNEDGDLVTILVQEDINSALNALESPYHIEDIQDAVENALMANRCFSVAKKYILYREKHKESRFIQSRLDYMDKYSNSTENAATSSETDANANVTMKNVANMEGEVYKATNRLVQRTRMKKRLKEMFPEVAEQYEKDLESHIIYAHDEATSPAVKNYCMAASLYPLMTEGTGNIDGVTPNPPNDIQSFSGQVTNLVFLLSSQVRGAVALGDYFVVLNYYVIAEFGKNWYDHLNDVVTTNVCEKQRTVKDAIRKGMKQFIYGVSQPAGNRSYNSPFSNLNLFDSQYFTAIFDEFYYPDGTKPEWKAIDLLQRIFLELHRELRLIKPLTFPVTTMCLLTDGNDIVDKEYKELCATELSKGSSFFVYLSDCASSISSCCFSKDQKILWKSSSAGVNLTTFEEFENLPHSCNKENLKIFHNGSWVKGKFVKLPNRKMYEITTFNNKKIVVTDNHLNPTLDGDKQTTELTTNDYLLFNQQPTQAIVENDEKLTYEQGFVVGSFLGDGSFGSESKGVIYDINFSQNLEKHKKCMEMIDVANQQVGGQSKSHLASVYNNVYPVRISSKELAAFIIKWTHWKRGTYAFNKKLNLNCLLQSLEFRKGILDGWYSTDGGNSNRCYTTSPELAEDMEVLITSLGMNSIIDVSDRTDEDVIIRGEIYKRNYPLYCIRWYEPANHRTNKDLNSSWKKKNNSIYFRIKDIKKVAYDGPVYCFECPKEEPYFTLPNGIITHNCRVRNEISENTFSSTTGLTGIMTGSSNVISLNFNRIVQDWYRSLYCNVEFGEKSGKASPAFIGSLLYTDKELQQSLKDYLIAILERVYKYQIAFKSLLYDAEDRGMFSSSNAGYIYTKKLYSTIGFIGYCEAAEFFGYTINYNNKYIKFLQLLLGTIEEQNKLHSIHDKKRPCIMNSEGIPKSLGM